MRSWGKTNLRSRNFHILDLGWGQFSGHPIISLWGKNQKAVFRQVWHETSSEHFQYVVLTRFWRKNWFFEHWTPQRSSEVTSKSYNSTANNSSPN